VGFPPLVLVGGDCTVKRRAVVSDEAKRVLQSTFEQILYPNKVEVAELARKMGLKPEQCPHGLITLDGGSLNMVGKVLVKSGRNQ
jgi:hypothetical protein